MSLLSNGAKDRWAHPLPVLSHKLDALPVLLQGWAINHTLVQTKLATTSFHPRTLYFILFKLQQLPPRKQNVSSLKTQLCKGPLKLHPSVLCKAKSQLALIKYRLNQPFADASLKTKRRAFILLHLEKYKYSRPG